MSDGWITIIALAVTAALIRASGPLFFGGRPLPGWLQKVIPLLAPALLAALIVTQALADEQEWAIGPDTAGVLAGGLAAWRTGSIVACVVVAAVVTAGLRAV